MAIINSTDENFEKLKSENKIFLAKMTASWCQPCKMLNPVLEEISEEMKDQLVIANHDIDSEPNVPTKFSIRGVPTLLLFKDGELKATKVGASLKSDVVSWIKGNI